MSAAPTLYATVLRLLAEKGWKLQADEERRSVTMLMEGRNGTWPCIVVAREQEQQILVYSASSLRVPPDRRTKLAETIARANFGMVIGNFELEMDTGEIRYKTSLDVSESELDGGLLERILRPNIQTMDRYLPTFAAAIHSDATPVQALARVEGAP
ncbi:MAG TPA: YbjN domain-containing protein [Kofleriaceae bacterium]|nr:YbjN domain-containing protein [Kofleriaceae bacterium]